MNFVALFFGGGLVLERVDVLGAGFFHPLDIALGALATSLVVAVLGLSSNAVPIAGLATLFMAVLQHLNVRTPVWLGYIMQRPESLRSCVVSVTACDCSDKPR